ncbi:MAG TPA: PfkB family carbohydrate kinase [Alphaproteobacteria bacterium]|nr:PfkB family carbohydrate kinase [Alphaproteobacteria bacterium]
MVDAERLKQLLENSKVKDIDGLFNSLKDIKVMIIGDTIIDHYVFVHPKGRAVKDPILSVEYLRDEKYAGGVLAVARHVSDFVDKIKVVTLLGEKEDHHEFIQDSIKGKNIDMDVFIKPNAFTTVKRRYIDYHRGNKLFKIEHIDEKDVDAQLTKKITEYLIKELPSYDLVMVSDFGHGFLNSELRKVIEENSKYLTINVQSNSSNMGYNYVTRYSKADYLTMNETEIRLPLMMRYEDISEVMKEFSNKTNFKNYLVTLGRRGSVFSTGEKMHDAPLLATTVVDTVGAGDAVFSFTSLLVFKKIDHELIPFFANCAGGVATNIMGNKDSIDKESIKKFILAMNA